MRMRNYTHPKFNLSWMKIDGGHITVVRSPIIGRPCFGIPTARLVHGYDDAIPGKDGRLRQTRCGQCPLKYACKHVVELRLLKSTDEVQTAYTEVVRRGGAHKIFDPKAVGIGPTIDALCRALHKAALTNANDDLVIKHFEAKRLMQLDADRVRQRDRRTKERAEAAAAGDIPTDVAIGLGDACRVRVERFNTALRGRKPPHWLARVPDDGSLFYGTVWAIDQRLRLAAKKAGTTQIARELQTLLPQWQTANFEALRKRVERALPHFNELERLMLPDGLPCWPRFVASDLL